MASQVSTLDEREESSRALQSWAIDFIAELWVAASWCASIFLQAVVGLDRIGEIESSSLPA